MTFPPQKQDIKWISKWFLPPTRPLAASMWPTSHLLPHISKKSVLSKVCKKPESWNSSTYELWSEIQKFPRFFIEKENEGSIWMVLNTRIQWPRYHGFENFGVCAFFSGSEISGFLVWNAIIYSRFFLSLTGLMNPRWLPLVKAYCLCPCISVFLQKHTILLEIWMIIWSYFQNPFRNRNSRKRYFENNRKSQLYPVLFGNTEWESTWAYMRFCALCSESGETASNSVWKSFRISEKAKFSRSVFSTTAGKTKISDTKRTNFFS